MWIELIESQVHELNILPVDMDKHAKIAQNNAHRNGIPLLTAYRIACTDVVLLGATSDEPDT